MALNQSALLELSEALRTADFSELMRRLLDTMLQVGPNAMATLAATRWMGHGVTAESSTLFFGNDILRVTDGRFVEWTPLSSGS